ncbi:hypothetical protein [Streptomyces violascens]|uniref:hypothetical protein n=1 Tax=Streptomyces violascens TaxID=67381 RepID=UPI00366A1C16
MRDYVKRLPPGARPEGGMGVWPLVDAERWLKARVPAVFAPVAGSWALLVAVVASYVLTSGWSGAASGGTDWQGYPATVLLAALPFWYRFLPVPTVPAALLVAGDAAISWASTDALGRRAEIGHILELGVAAWTLAGACLRLRARRRQRALVLATAGQRRYALPGRAPESDGYRGFRQFYLGLALCLVGVAILADGLVASLSVPDGTPAYNAIGQQTTALLLFVTGTTVYGWGHVAFRAARRLHDESQPALRVGVRIGADGYHWLYPDALTTSARPLIAYFPKDRDTVHEARFLGTSSAYGPDDGHYDIDPRSEPFEAVLYGVPCEGAEIAVEYAVIGRPAYQAQERTHAAVTVAALLPRRRHGFGPWQPADGAVRDTTRRDRIREEERAKREREARREAHQRPQDAKSAARPRPSRGGRSRPARSGRPKRWDGGGSGCGGGAGGCGSGGGHGGGHGCGGHGCGGG